MSSEQGSISVAFLVIAVLIAAKHTDVIQNAIGWIKKPAQKQAA